MRNDSDSALATLSVPEPAVRLRESTAGQAAPRAVLSSVHVAISYQLGGSGRVFAELAHSLPSAGVGFLGAVAEPDNVRALSGGSVEQFAPSSAGMKSRLKAARHVLLELIEAAEADVFASHFALYAAPLLDKLYRRRDFAFVSHFHGPWAAESLEEGAGKAAITAKRMLEKTVYARADRTIVLSHAFARIAVEQYGIAEDRIAIVPGCVDVHRFNIQQSRREARASLALPLDRPILTTVRRLVHRMGLRPLLEAMREIVRAVPEVLLLIGGEGPLRGQLETLVAEYGLQANVRLLGFVTEEQLPTLYRAADINVVPSQALEGFGLVAVEALAAGTPSMVTPVGGLPEIVSGLSRDLIFASTQPYSLAEGLIEALQGATRLPDAAQCRDYTVRNFTSALMAARIADVYRRVA